ncbi:MAG: PAS domain S-box protein [Candidatus Hydrogenedentes bacterium]|nr:PAS domain S-box protein [Candidatus Hydrogenedentota bacterium]
MSILSEFEWKGPLYGSICLLASVYLFFAFRRYFAARARGKNHFRISFSAGAYLIAAFTVTAIASQQAASTTTYVEVVKWSQMASLVGQVSLVLLVTRLTNAVPRSALVALTGSYAAAALMHVVSVSGTFVSYFGEIHIHPLPILRDLLVSRVPYAVWKAPVDLTNSVAFIAIAWACWRLHRRAETALAMRCALLASVVFLENMHDMYFADDIYLAPFGLVLMLIVFLLCPEGLHPPDRANSRTAARSATRRVYPPPDIRVARETSWEHNPLIGLIMAMFLVSAAQALAWNGFESAVILLALLGMGQATISVLNRAGSGVEMRILAVGALAIIALPQLADIIYAVPNFSGSFIQATRGMLHSPMRDLLWILGLLLLLTAFSLSGIEAGEVRRRLLLEHRQLVEQIAERKHAERELQASERRFRRLVENSTDLVVILGHDGIVLDVGASVARILGYGPGELVGRTVASFCHPEDHFKLAHALKHISPLATPVQSVEISVRVPDGSWRVLECISDLQFDPVLNGVIVNARDITERKAMEERLRSARTDERQLIRYNLHDTVGQDLAGLLCMTGSLAMELQSVSAPLATQADAIVEGVQRTMDDVRKAILGIAPIELHPRGLEVALQQLVERLVDCHRVDIRFVCTTAIDIEDYGVATQLFQIAQEALTNAIKHARAEHIVVTLASAGDRVALTIADDGVGLEARAKSPDGLGLQTMRSRAAAIGAWLRISGANGKGTQVKCVLSRELHGDLRSESGVHWHAE